MGVRSWFRVPALWCSRVPGILGMRARGKANFLQERRTRKYRNANFTLLWRNIEHTVFAPLIYQLGTVVGEGIYGASRGLSSECIVVSVLW